TLGDRADGRWGFGCSNRAGSDPLGLPAVGAFPSAAGHRGSTSALPDNALRSYVSPSPAGIILAAENVGGWEALSSAGKRSARTSAGVGGGVVFHGNRSARTSAGVAWEASSDGASPDEGRRAAGAASRSDPAPRRRPRFA